MKYIPVSERAKRKFKEYEEYGFKALKVGVKGDVLFANKECVLNPIEEYFKTLKFAFWLEKEDVKEIE